MKQIPGQCEPNPNFLDVTKFEEEKGREDTQAVYQHALAAYLNNCTLLDVGAGLCESLARFQVRNIRPMTQDIFPGSKADFRCGVEQIPDGCFDVVAAFDVIEHVPDSAEWFAHLVRIARRNVYVSTPNFTQYGCKHVYHFREFTPAEIIEHGESLGLTVEAAWMIDETLPMGSQFTRVGRDALHANTTCGNYGVLFRK